MRERVCTILDQWTGQQRFMLRHFTAQLQFVYSYSKWVLNHYSSLVKGITAESPNYALIAACVWH